MVEISLAARPRLVVVGAGFGGLELVKGLAQAPIDITLVDRQNHHCFQPLLYQVATASLSPADIAWPIRGILKRQRNVEVLMAEATGVDLAARAVLTGSTRHPFDFLVLATGATHSYFGHDDWAGYAPGLKQIDDATDIRRRVLLAFEEAEAAADDAVRVRFLTFVVVGGGPTGVEMAGAIADLAHKALPLDFRHIDPRKARIVLVEAGPRLLPAFAVDQSAYAKAALERMGVEVRLGTPVTGCDALGVSLDGARIEAATAVWAAGVVASPAGRWLGTPTDKAGRVRVGPDLTVPGMRDIFVIGDTALVEEDGKPVPGIAQGAKQMGKYVAKVIAARLAGAVAPPPFRYRHLGELATIGRKSAVVHLGGLKLRGFPGWLFWSAVHIYFLIGTRSRFTVAFDWAWNYVTYQRSARLITRLGGAGATLDPSRLAALAPQDEGGERHADSAGARPSS